MSQPVLSGLCFLSHQRIQANQQHRLLLEIR
jgi:hypothetical protein